ncbi:hypothetical protein LCGC14_1420750 [marine sediment metagenome]|uniref:Radical SAM core domain-containing protein n=1 Tax=marine sediment metagenome TaxID=412755 RepID=A0A0F9MT51_9ZZZZ
MKAYYQNPQATLIRVFPRRTSYTPTDEYAFVGDPPLIRPDGLTVHVSVVFTWDQEEGERLATAWAQYYPSVQLGGPAFGNGGNNFVPGRYVVNGVTFTSRGCNRKCPWCLVPEREGRLSLLSIASGNIIQDNNLLACPRAHISAVFEMLKRQRRSAIFAGGLDASLVDDWVAQEMAGLRIGSVFLAADTRAAVAPLREATRRLSFLSRRKLRCYVLIGFGGESIAAARERLEAVWEAGCLPFAQLYQPPDQHIYYDAAWRALAREWSRPAAMFANHRSEVLKSER